MCDVLPIPRAVFCIREVKMLCVCGEGWCHLKEDWPGSEDLLLAHTSKAGGLGGWS